jgi:hypothetical protein
MKWFGRKKVDPDFRVDFLGIGVAKSGSTWLADKLRLHPQIFVPDEKSIYYFNQYMGKGSKQINENNKRPLQWYHSFFAEASPRQITGEISPEYLMHENCAKDIFDYNPNIKLLVTLRDPVQRAHSQYLFRQQTGLSRYPSFEAAIGDFPLLLDTGFYYRHLKRYFDLFPRENIKVMFYEDLKKDGDRFYRNVLSFLGAEEYRPEGLETRSNVTMEVRSRALARLITSTDLYIQHRSSLRFVRTFINGLGLHKMAKAVSRANKQSATEKPRLDKALESSLREHFREDIENLERLLKKDLSHWK